MTGSQYYITNKQGVVLYGPYITMDRAHEVARREIEVRSSCKEYLVVQTVPVIRLVKSTKIRSVHLEN